MIPLNFPLGCGPGPDSPSISPLGALLLCPSVMAFWFCGLLIESGLLLWPFGKVAVWLKVVCYGLLVRPSGVVVFCYSLLVWWSSVIAFLPPLDHTKPEGTKPAPNQKATKLGHFQPEGHQTRRTLSARRPPNQKATFNQRRHQTRRPPDQKATKPEGHNRRPHPLSRHPP